MGRFKGLTFKTRSHEAVNSSLDRTFGKEVRTRYCLMCGGFGHKGCRHKKSRRPKKK